MTAHPEISRLTPGNTIGILGGGQLGRLLSIAAANLGLKSIVYCPDPKCPASDVANDVIKAHYTDNEALKAFCGKVSVVTYEFENVPVDAAITIEQCGIPVRPGKRALEVAQDRLVEKEFLNGLDIQTAPFQGVDSLEDLKEGLARIGRPAILKTRRLGYDGKGQTRITTDDTDLSSAYDKAIAHAWSEVGAAPSILEGFIPFTREFSVVIARDVDGKTTAYEPIENVHKDGILATSTIPALVSVSAKQNALRAAEIIVEALNYIGVLAVEFFELSDGTIIANEMAPRVHNSGHLTLDACAVSQFEQQIRAVAGWPLGDTRAHSAAQMENLIGADVLAWRNILTEPSAALYLYGKNEARPGRKMGHVTRLHK